MALVWADLAALIRFFSRVPVPRANRLDDPAALPRFDRAGALMPLCGAVLALPACLVLAGLGQTALPAAAVALLAVATGVIVTGALHEDGLADVADGFFGAHRRERRLEIMKDSRIGAFGAIALIIALSLRAVLLASLLERAGVAATCLALIVVEAWSRAAIAVVWACLPSARPDGLAAACGRPGGMAAAGACALSLAAALPLLPLAGTAVALAALLAGLAAFGIARLAMARIGGQTGDVLGATQQVTLLAALAGLTAVQW